MTKPAEIIQEIKNACTSLFTRISAKKVSEDDLSDTELPALIISELNTTFSKQLDLNAEETYEIKLLIMLDSGVDNPIQTLTAKQKEVITALLTYKPLLTLVGMDGIVLKSSTASNSIEQYKKGSAIICILTIECNGVVAY